MCTPQEAEDAPSGDVERSNLAADDDMGGGM